MLPGTIKRGQVWSGIECTALSYGLTMLLREYYVLLSVSISQDSPGIAEVMNYLNIHPLPASFIG
jgi:hypothetical protein